MQFNILLESCLYYCIAVFEFGNFNLDNMEMFLLSSNEFYYICKSRLIKAVGIKIMRLTPAHITWLPACVKMSNWAIIHPQLNLLSNQTDCVCKPILDLLGQATGCLKGKIFWTNI